jgi:tryptophan 2,3-dioxygenase
MESQNVTLAIPKATLRKAKLIAVERQTSLSRLLTELVERLVSDDNRYVLARERHLAILESGFSLGTGGGPLASREELHER